MFYLSLTDTEYKFKQVKTIILQIHILIGLILSAGMAEI